MGSSRIRDLGALGFLKVIVDQVNSYRNLGGDGFRGLVMFGCWLASVGNKALSRLSFVVGTATTCFILYNYILTVSRLIIHSIGERILEPNFDHN